ncbi:helix-turn-helix transcriptional regulator [Actinoallomurus sp. NPDC052274]|uniref:helix-turn-helix domain-containing protein n=1 Tax=Actinoallomurus sp. NPDC052274 TaxID=3155420 RepID=UPI0034133041
MHDLRQERLQELGHRVRGLRKGAGLSGAELAERAGVTQPTVSKIETGRMLPSSEVFDRLAGALGIDQGERAELFALLQQVHTEVADIRQSGNGALAQQEAISTREQRAAAVDSFQCAMVPSLLQTAEYARRAFEAAGHEDDRDVGRAVAARVERQGVLYERGRRFSFVLTEGALRTWPGSPDVMRAQLAKILDVSTLENVSVSVVPWSATVPTFPLHGFVIYDESAITVETFTSELLLSNAQDVAIYRQTFAAFREVALFGDAMRELVSRIARDYDQSPFRR